MLLTMILDLGGDNGARADELAAAYHERWTAGDREDQLKTHLRGPGRVLRHSWRPRSQPDALGSSILVVTVCREDLDQRADQREVLVLGVVRIRPEGRDGQVGHVPIVAADGQRVIDQLDEAGQGGPGAATRAAPVTVACVAS